jgi:DegV family protein with EDD domain
MPAGARNGRFIIFFAHRLVREPLYLKRNAIMIQIIADTLSCISPAEASALGISYLPQIVVFGEETYRDDTEMDPPAFLKRLRSSAVLPKTAAPPPALYLPIYREFAARGDTMIVVAPSQQVSGTYRSALTAAQDFRQENPEADIRVIDTQLIGGGLGAVVKQALRWAQAGKPADFLVENILDLSSREKIYFLVDTLEYLYRGGRIGAAKALFGSLLQVKPILTIHQGHTEARESQRTHKRALARLKEIVLADCPRDPEAHLSIMQGDAEELAHSVAADLSSALGIPVQDIPIYNLTPAILTHAGPGALAISYFLAPGQEGN